ncbi:TonB-dependent receptor domain-containing protein [Mangrovibacterium diazotrophicum]|uniref:TonB-dependent receptor-like protein n=1 Tax=Mangrovibacterium diazotrophicum TaxID=1261403 RepID=A0A419W5A9_9BACT|nr:TonB-dependent receptor [Mangrovibacterium diazotrophicum]RKD90625.1 TonB-dependent receptor-like protein [Mangrovibacterium diazotrophicum]
MKKNRTGKYFSGRGMSEILLKMKLLTLFVLISLVSSAASSYSQQTKFSFKLNKVTVGEVFQEIEQNSEFILLYNENQLDVNRQVSVIVENGNIEAVLEQALEGSGTTYKIYDRQIVIKPKDSPEPSVVPAEQKKEKEISGTVHDDKGNPVPGATVIVKGTTIGTITDPDGYFALDVPIDAQVLSISFVGFESQDIIIGTQTSFQVVLKESTQGVDEVVVTGVFDPRSRMEASVAITAIKSQQIEQLAVTSAGDLLKNVPGVFVNTSLGEIRNTVYSRGVSVGSNDGESGYYYVSMQEDGLPVTNATFGNYGPDYYLRPDATLGRLEAVRGGTASILGNNAPGGIFNYVSKTGGEKFEGEVRAKYGLEGNGRNPYYRADFDLGGSLDPEKTLRYNIGGFYRRADGARYPGYPMNEGGQIKANLLKNYTTGRIKFYAKYLNDKNAWFEFLPSVDFDNPRLADGVKQYYSVLIPPVTADFRVNQTDKIVHFDSRDKIHSIDKSFGMNWEQNFGEGWKIDNKMRYSMKSSVWNTTAVAYPIAVDNLIFHAIAGTLGHFGTYTFNDLKTGNLLGKVLQSPNIIDGNFAGFNFTMLDSNFPGESIQANSLLMNPVVYLENEMDEYIDQLTISKKLNNMSFTAGMFYAHSKLDQLSGFGAAESFSQMTSPRPSQTEITLEGFDGQTYYVTNPDGIIGGTGASAPFDYIAATQSQTAFFFGHNWEITEGLNLDWGIRYERIAIKGENQWAAETAVDDGGNDGNIYTLYDNYESDIAEVYSYDNQVVNTFSFSAGVNYKFTDVSAVYGRYSQGEKAPDLSIFVAIDNQFALDNLDPQSQKIQQLEVGYKMNGRKHNLFVTPFLSFLSNVPQQTVASEDGSVDGMYSLPTLYNEYRTFGVEIESIYDFTDRFSVRTVATFQDAVATKFQTWDVGDNGSGDDVIIDFSGNKTDNSAHAIIRISPSYNTDKMFVSADFSYLGKRAANVANVFDLPSYNQTNLNFGYNFTSKWQIQLNINNVFNQNGVMGWSAPGGFPSSLDRQGFTQEDLDANPDAVYSTLSLPPRAYFVTLSYKF